MSSMELDYLQEVKPMKRKHETKKFCSMKSLQKSANAQKYGVKVYNFFRLRACVNYVLTIEMAVVTVFH